MGGMKIYSLILSLLMSMAGAACVAPSSAQRPAAPVAGAPQTPVDGSMSVAASGHRHTGAHMRMTESRTAAPGDRQRADEIVRAARQAIGKYEDFRVALREGYQILQPDVPQSMYHFNNYAHAAEAERRFNPAHPTSLLYEKTRDGYRLIGVMYTAPAALDEDQLDARIPVSVARWHQHINICLPPGAGWEEGIFSSDARFGLNGSIETAAACREAGGQFVPRLFGWMVHLYPFERDASEVWSVERQVSGGAQHEH